MHQYFHFQWFNQRWLSRNNPTWILHNRSKNRYKSSNNNRKSIRLSQRTKCSGSLSKNSSNRNTGRDRRRPGQEKRIALYGTMEIWTNSGQKLPIFLEFRLKTALEGGSGSRRRRKSGHMSWINWFGKSWQKLAKIGVKLRLSSVKDSPWQPGTLRRWSRKDSRTTSSPGSRESHGILMMISNSWRE